jgi:hypothetical protein
VVETLVSLAIEESLEAAEREFREKANKERREALKREFIETKNLGFMLVDFIPYANKSKLIEGLNELFSPEDPNQPMSFDEPRLDQIPDIKESGVLSGGGTTPIGIIFNSDISGDRFFRGIQKKLPAEFFCLEVCVGQFIDYAYYVVYSCLLKEEYQTKEIERLFIESEDWVPYRETTPNGREMRGEKPKGPDLEPTIRGYQTNMEKYLRPFSHGLFLNSSNEPSVCCPNVKVLSVPKIDFNSFDTWETGHRSLLRFLGFEFLYCKHDRMMIGYYRKSLFSDKPSSAFQGLVFLASLCDFKSDGFSKPEHEVFHNVHWFTIHDIAIPVSPYLLANIQHRSFSKGME